MIRFLAGLVSLLLIAAIAAAGLSFYFASEFKKPGPLQADTTIVMPRGGSLGRIADKLEQTDVIGDARIFVAMARFRGQARTLKAGEYQIPAGSSMAQVLQIIVEGKALMHKLTVPEGRTTAEVLALVATAPVLNGDISLTPAEGALKPDTYFFERDETRDGLIKRMIDDQTATLARLWAVRAEGLPIATPEEALILASIVEKETGVPEERPMVAAVFTNRLRKGMRLQSDPTIIYGLTGGVPLGRKIRRSELDRKTPYNTYHISGLTPTPIANPGEAAIAATLNPTSSTALYFVADGTGGHAFANTLREHEKNVANWRKIERARKAAE